MSMKTVSYQDWTFVVDVEKTKLICGEIHPSAAVLRGFLPELTGFLKSLAIDIDKPIERTDGELIYQFFGTAFSEQGYEIDFYGADKFASVVVYPGDGIRVVTKLALYGIGNL